MRLRTTALALAVGALTTTVAFGDEEMKRELDRIRSRMEQMERDHKREMDALRNELAGSGGSSSALEAEVDQLMERVGSLEGEIRSPRKNVASRGYVDVSLNALLVAGASEADDETLRALNAGGHDPGRRGFTSQGIELTLKGGVDPYWDALATIVHVIDPETNDSFVEVEEAWMSSAAIVDGVRLRAGQFYTVFGRHNEQHAHVWEFVNAPVVNTRFLGGDGMRGLGFDASWLGPEGFPVELTGSVQNADGETMASFLGSREEEHDEEEEEGHGHSHGPASTPGESVGREVRSLEELVYSFRAAMPWRPSDEHEVLFGGSWAMGPSGAGAATDARVAGLDVT